MISLSWRGRRSLASNPRRIVRRAFRPALEKLEDRMAPAVLTVNSTADTANASDTYLSLREAIAIVNSNTLPTGLSSQILAQISGTLHAGHSDTIQFDHTRVTSPITTTGDGLGVGLTLSLPSSTAAITIDGGAPAVTVDGNDSNKVFFVFFDVDKYSTPPQVTLANLLITGGNGDETSGGAIFNGGTLRVANCTFLANHANGSLSLALNGGGAIVNEGTLTVANSTFGLNRADSSNGGGGAISNEGTLTVSGCNFQLNGADNTINTFNDGPRGGGAIFSTSGSVLVSGSTFFGNTASRTNSNTSDSTGGAIYISGGTMTVSGSEFLANQSLGGGGGGAIFNNATLTVINSSFGSNDPADGNNADGSLGGGGAISNLGTLTVTGSTLVGNHADNIQGGGFTGGGAISNLGTLTVTNSTLVGNHDDNAYFGGGAIYNSGTATVVSSTLTLNHANDADPYEGGGGGINAGGYDNGTLKLINTIVALNTADNSNGPDVFQDPHATVDSSSRFNLIGDGSGISGISNGVLGNQIGTAASPIDARLGPIQNNGGLTETVELMAGSPALNAGDPLQVGSVDQRGVPRLPFLVNIGAFQASATVFQVGIPGTLTAGTPFTFTVTAMDRFGQQAYGYRGSVHFSSSDPQAGLPGDYTFTAADNGTHTFSGVFLSAGSQTTTVNNGAFGGLTEFSLPTASSEPTDITADPYGDVWFTEADNSKIAKINQAGVVTEFAILKPDSRPRGITMGPDGNLWFTEENGNKIGQITPAGTITEFPVPTPDSDPAEITAGADGNLWFTENAGNQIGRITPAGVITEFPIPTSGSNPTGITAGPDGNLWFAEILGNKIGRITPAGVITEFAIPTASSGLEGITAGQDGNLWFTEVNGNKVGKITPGGVVTEFPIPTSGSRPQGITAGPDGNLWFTELDGNKVGRITPAGVITEFSIPTSGSAPYGITADAFDGLWFAEELGNKVGRITTLTASAPVSVVAAPAIRYAITPSAFTVVPGDPFSVSVTALDSYGNADTGYRGTVHFTSSDPFATLPADYTFTAADNGVHSFSPVILYTAGFQTITASDGVIGGDVPILVFAPPGRRANPPLNPNTNAPITPALSAPGGELTAVDRFFALVNRKGSAIASQADSAVGNSQTNASVAACFQTPFRLDGTQVGGQMLATALNVDDLLLAVNKKAVNGALSNGDSTLQAQAAELFSALNQAGSM